MYRKQVINGYYTSLFLVVYSRSRKRLEEYLDKKFGQEHWGDWRLQGNITKEQRPTWVKYNKILGT